MIITRDVTQQAQEAFDNYIAAMSESDYMDIEIPMNAADWVPKLLRLVGELKQEEARLREVLERIAEMKVENDRTWFEYQQDLVSAVTYAREALKGES